MEDEYLGKVGTLSLSLHFFIRLVDSLQDGHLSKK